MIERKTLQQNRTAGVIKRKTLQQKRTAGVNERKTRRAGKPLRRRNRNTSPRRQPPRAPTPLPELYPAKRNIPPAHNSRSYEAEERIFASARTSALIGSRAKRSRPDRRPSARNNIILRRNRPSLRRIISPFPCPLPEFNLQWGGKTVIIKTNKRNAERHKSQRFAHREPELLKAGGEARFFSTFQGGRR